MPIFSELYSELGDVGRVCPSQILPINMFKNGFHKTETDLRARFQQRREERKEKLIQNLQRVSGSMGKGRRPPSRYTQQQPDEIQMLRSEIAQLRKQQEDKKEDEKKKTGPVEDSRTQVW